MRSIILPCLTLGLVGSGALFLWAATLRMPDLNTFEERKVLQSTKIYDRTGEILLYDVHENIKRTVVPFGDISRHAKNAAVAIEDSEFYEHRGVKPTAFLRALLVNLAHFEFSQGGSTITQQVVKNSILTQEKSIARKLKEWILAIKLEQVASKEQILGLYLNEAPYGGNIYGVEEASRVFFGKDAKDLSLSESAYLAALPQAPTFYSPHGGNRDKLEKRKDLVLERMASLHFITDEEYETAKKERVSFLPPENRGVRAPHFVFYVREQLEKKFGKDVLETGGLKVTTTLDVEMQERAEEVIARFAEENAKKYNAHNMALVAIDPKTGQILAMVGSRDYFAKSEPDDCSPGINCVFDPQVNVATVNPGRQPGSAFKPFVYATAFMKGYTPETVVFDLETQFHSECDPDGKPLFETVKPEECYMPENYDEIFRGPVTLRNALAQSINVPAIKVLYLAGLRDSLETARNVGITSLNDPDRYGLTLVLGGGEVSLLELTMAYSVLANEGVRNQHASILEVKGREGTPLVQFKQSPVRVMPANIALQVSDILKDEEARSPAFGHHSYLYLGDRDVAVKTGTTNDYRDAWILGYTPNIAVGMWAGNNDNTPMEKRVAGFIVAPPWNAFLSEVFKNLPREEFKAPEKDSAWDSLKPLLRGVWAGGESYFVDRISQKLATVYTPKETREERVVPNIHSELFWIDKADPRGAPPLHPEKDPQFALWETSVAKWAVASAVPNAAQKPTGEDSIHSPELAPTVVIKNIESGKLYPPNQKITLSIEGSGKYGLAGVELYVNNIYVGKTAQKPFTFSFVPENVLNIQRENVLRVEGYDSVWNRGTVEMKLLVDI